MKRTVRFVWILVKLVCWALAVFGIIVALQFLADWLAEHHIWVCWSVAGVSALVALGAFVKQAWQESGERQ